MISDRASSSDFTPAFCKQIEPGVWAVVRRENGVLGPGWSAYLQLQDADPTGFSYAERSGGCFAEEALDSIEARWPETKAFYKSLDEFGNSGSEE